jgi:S-adenosyl methyltransferase
MTRPDWAPEDVDLSKPNAARVYDYLLGGSSNFAIDREFAAKAMEFAPDAVSAARKNRHFLRRAVRFCVQQGIRQFLDLGSGVPTEGNVHDIAQSADPACRVAYVDNEPVAVAHSRAMLRDNELTTTLGADLREPETILHHPETLRLLDFSAPIAVLLVAALPFVSDADDPAGIVARYRDAVVPGSFLVLSHGTTDHRDQATKDFAKHYQSSATPLFLRSYQQIEALFAGWDFVEPGLVPAPLWRPESVEDVGENPERTGIYAGVARKTLE